MPLHISRSFSRETMSMWWKWHLHQFLRSYCEVIYFVVIFLLGTKLFEKSSLWYWFTELSCKFREIFFLQASKVLWCCCAFVLLWLLIGPRIWHYFLNQSNSNVKPITIWFCNHSSESIFVYNLLRLVFSGKLVPWLAFFNSLVVTLGH